MNTYFVSGILRNDDPTRVEKRVRQEIEAESPAAAIDLFQVGDWEFDPVTLVVWRVTETDRMEAAGQPTLFDTSGLETISPIPKDHELREAWRRLETWHGRLIRELGLEKDRKVVYCE